MDLVEKWLVSWITSPQRVEPDALSGKVYFRAHETMGPFGIDGKDMSQESSLSSGIGTAEEDDAPFRRCLEVEFPVFGERVSRWSVFDSGGSASATCGDEFCRPRLQSTARCMSEAGPDFGLPTTVEVLDGRLEPRLLRRSEDRNHLQGQTEAAHAADGVGMVVGSLEHGVVVELDIGGQSMLSPVLKESFYRGFCRDCLLLPGGGQSSMEGNSVEDFHVGAAADDQPLDDIEAVQFRTTGGNLGEIPSSRRGGPANPPAAIQGPTAFQNASDGPRGKRRANTSPLQLPADRHGPVLAQGAGFLQFSPQAQHEILQGGRGLVDRLAAARKLARPVHSIEPLPSRTSYPSSDQRPGYAEPSGDLVDRVAISDRLDHCPTPRFLAIPSVDFLPMSTSSISVFPLFYTRLRGDASGVTQGGREC